jgi:hypothetical protein
MGAQRSCAPIFESGSLLAPLKEQLLEAACPGVSLAGRTPPLRVVSHAALTPSVAPPHGLRISGASTWVHSGCSFMGRQSGKQMLAIVGSDCRSIASCIEQSRRISLVHAFRDLLGSEPVDSHGFG